MFTQRKYMFTQRKYAPAEGLDGQRARRVDNSAILGMKNSPPATLWDIRWFRYTCLTVILAPPILFVVGTAGWAVALMMSGEFDRFQQAWNGISVFLILALLYLSLFWFIYRDYQTTQNLNPEPK